MKPRILIFSTAYLPFVGGAEIAVKEITNRLYNYDFDLITARLSRSVPKSERVGNVQVYRVGIGIPFVDKIFLTLFGQYRALQLHAKAPYQGVWGIMASFGGFAASCFSKKTNTPFLLTLQEGDPLEYIEEKVKFVKKYFTGIFKRAKILQAISFFLLDWGKKNGFSGDYGVVVPNGVDVARFTHHYTALEIEAVRKKFNVPTDAKICITVSRLVKKNGVGTIIEALSYTSQDIHLIVCGNGPLEKKLKQLAENKKVSSRVHFMGTVAQHDLPLMLKAANVFVRPSLSEGLGNAFLEAMAAGVVTIGTPVGGIPDFLKDGETGFLTDPNNPTDLAKTIERAFALKPHEKHLLHDRAVNLVKKQYNWDIIAEEMDTLFKRLCV